jgi:O-antigen/teichoic acid export membrane protein
MMASLLLIARNLWTFYAATVVTELGGIAVLGVLLFGWRRRAWPSVRAFSRSLYGTLLRFGLPMMLGYELSGIILIVGDRYIIHILMPGDWLGVYSAAYNLCQYMQLVLGAAVEQALAPIYLRLWSQGSEEEFNTFINKTLRWYVMLGVPVVAGMAAVGPQLLPLLASEKYALGAGIIPYVMAGMMLDGTTAMVGAGLFIHKRSKIIAVLVLFSATLNILLNLVLIPFMGLYGAAVATLVSYLALASAMVFAGRRWLPVVIPKDVLAKAVGLALAMYFVVTMIDLPGRVATIGVKLIVGVVFYAAGMSAIDRDARRALRAGLEFLAARVPSRT